MNWFSREHLSRSREWFFVDQIPFLVGRMDLTGTRYESLRALIEARLSGEHLRTRLFAAASTIARRLRPENPWAVLIDRIPGLASRCLHSPPESRAQTAKVSLAQAIQGRLLDAEVCLILASGHFGLPGAAVGIGGGGNGHVLYFGMEPWRYEIRLGRDGTIDHECVHLVQEVVASALARAENGDISFWTRCRYELQAHVYGNAGLLISFLLGWLGLPLAPLLLGWVASVVGAAFQYVGLIY
ncbi:MAG: hypothetical protein ACYDH9_14140 [Limisphaerales bacterium]